MWAADALFLCGSWASCFISPASLPGIEQIISVKLLGIHLTATLSAAVHVEHILSLANQRLHLLGLLKYQGLSPEALHLIFTSIVQSVITYALPSYAGQLSKGDKSRINPFVSTPVAATGFQTQATYYTCRSDRFTVPKRKLLCEPVVVHKKCLLKSANILHGYLFCV